MIIFYSRVSCYINSQNQNFNVNKDLPYELTDISTPVTIFSEYTLPSVLDYNSLKGSKDFSFYKHKGDEYILYSPKCLNTPCNINFSSHNQTFSVSLFYELNIFINEESVIEEKVYNLTYKRHESFFQYDIIYFSSENNDATYVAIFSNSTVIYHGYYHEINIKDDEILFLNKRFDMMNLGQVIKLNKSNIEKYLVYLDEQDLNLKDDFIPFVFLDNLLAGNFSYCNNLLYKEIQLDKAEEISSFFPEFDDYIVISNTDFLLTKKDTFVGALSIELFEDKIINLTCA